MNQNDKDQVPKLIPAHGGYRDLQSYRMAEIVCDTTVVFCDRFGSMRSRTHDQVVRALAFDSHWCFGRGNQSAASGEEL